MTTATATITTMVEPTVYLEKLSIFARMLRLEGFAVGPAETGDAAKILITLGMAERQQVKTALRTVYAKSREEQISFDRELSLPQKHLRSAYKCAEQNLS